jgi:tetratricopeptide (TPR) repeat protein
LRHGRKSAHVFAALALATSAACGGWRSRPAEQPTPSGARGTAELQTVPYVPGQTRAIIRELEEKIRRNPDDFVAHNKLSAYYLQLAREVDDDRMIETAERFARASLSILPAEQNQGALAALAEVEKATHRFAEARDHAIQLIRLDPRKAYPRSLLFDALFELGDYDGAARALDELRRAAGDSLTLSSREARFALIHGRLDEARTHLARSLAHARALSVPQTEPVAWSQWQTGETYFAAGDYDAAEHHFREALATEPENRAALAALARARAARGDLNEAIKLYEQVVRVAPHIEFTAPLGDLYKLAGRDREAAAHYTQAEEAGRGSDHDNRTLALFLADHDLKIGEAYERARREYERRRDIYTADAVAWAASKAGRHEEAREKIKEATRLGTLDARLLYHAGMIALAAGDADVGRAHLRRALELSPGFDPLQSRLARKALGE